MAPITQPLGTLGTCRVRQPSPSCTCQQTFPALLSLLAFPSDFPRGSSWTRNSRKAPGASIALLRDGDERHHKEGEGTAINELLQGDELCHPLAGCHREQVTLGCPSAMGTLLCCSVPTMEQQMSRPGVLPRCWKEGQSYRHPSPSVPAVLARPALQCHQCHPAPREMPTSDPAAAARPHPRVG